MQCEHFQNPHQRKHYVGSRSCFCKSDEILQYITTTQNTFCIECFWIVVWLIFQQHQSIPRCQIISDNCICCHTEIETAYNGSYLMSSPSHSKQAPIQPVQALTQQRQPLGRVAAGEPLPYLGHWHDSTQSLGRVAAGEPLPYLGHWYDSTQSLGRVAAGEALPYLGHWYDSTQSLEEEGIKPRSAALWVKALPLGKQGCADR